MRRQDLSGRQVARLVVDVLATPEQVHHLAEVLGTAVCGEPDDHEGPCRVAWRLLWAREDGTASAPGAGGLLAQPDSDGIRRALEALEALPPDAATRSLRHQVAATTAGYAECRSRMSAPQ